MAKRNWGIYEKKDDVAAMLRASYDPAYFFKLPRSELDALSLDVAKGMLQSYVHQLNMTLVSRRRVLEKLFDVMSRYEFALRKISYLELKKNYKPRYTNLHKVVDVKRAEQQLTQEILKTIKKGMG